MVILLGKIDTETIWIIGGWCINKMLCCLHVTARPLVQGHAATMVASVYYTLIPESTFHPSAVGTPAG